MFKLKKIIGLLNKKLFFFFIKNLIVFNLFSFEFSKDSYVSMSKNVPDWVYDQIESDLDHCVLERHIEEEYNYLINYFWNSRLLLFRIKNNKTVYLGPEKLIKYELVKDIHDFFQKASKHVEFPDVDFIVCLGDTIEKYLSDPRTAQVNIPIFTISKKKNTSQGILYPCAIKFMKKNDQLLKSIEKKSKEINWKSKINQYYWRGAPSGIDYENGLNSRLRIVKFSMKNSKLVNASFVNSRPRLTKIKNNFLKNLKVLTPINPVDQIKYKYLIAIEGNSFPSSQHWQLYSNSLTLIVDNSHIEWYYSGIKPFVHYVPLKNDYSDLEEKMLWLKQNDLLAKKIAQNATKFVRGQLSNERIVHYFYLLLHRYKDKFKQQVEPR